MDEKFNKPSKNDKFFFKEKKFFSKLFFGRKKTEREFKHEEKVPAIIGQFRLVSRK